LFGFFVGDGGVGVGFDDEGGVLVEVVVGFVVGVVDGFYV